MKPALDRARAVSKRRWRVEGDPDEEVHTYEAIARHIRGEDLRRIDELQVGAQCTVKGCIVVRIA